MILDELISQLLQTKEKLGTGDIEIMAFREESESYFYIDGFKVETDFGKKVLIEIGK